MRALRHIRQEAITPLILQTHEEQDGMFNCLLTVRGDANE